MFSIIIPTYNRNVALGKCLDSILPQIKELSGYLVEIIVSDDGDSYARHNLQEIYSTVNFIKGPQKGPAANRNHGAKQAKYDWLIFLDDDIIPDANLLSIYAKAIAKHPTSLAFEGAILPDDEGLLKKDLAECPINTSGGCFWTANVMIKKSLFEKVGGFDEDFLIAAQEDQELFERLKLETDVVFIADAIVEHPVRFQNLLGKIKSIPIQSENYAKYLHKTESILIHQNKPHRLLASGFLFYTKKILIDLRSSRFKTALIDLAWLFIGVPLNAYYYKKHSI